MLPIHMRTVWLRSDLFKKRPSSTTILTVVLVTVCFVAVYKSNFLKKKLSPTADVPKKTISTNNIFPKIKCPKCAPSPTVPIDEPTPLQMGKIQLENSFNWRRKKEFFANSFEKRSQYLSQNKSQLTKMAIQQQADCPGLVRVGDPGYGGKFICSPWSLPEYCVVYSMGVRDEVTFEAELIEIVGERCSIFGFDPLPHGPMYNTLKSTKAKLFTYAITGEDHNMQNMADSNFTKRSIRELMFEFRHNYIHVLKIDIEHGEYDALAPILSWPGQDPTKDVLQKPPKITYKKSFVCHLLLEVHREKDGEMEPLMGQLEAIGFHLLAKEPNSYCDECLELAYIHDTCRKEYGATDRYLENFGWSKKKTYGKSKIENEP